MRSGAPGGHRGRSGCSASKVSATRKTSFTHGSSPWTPERRTRGRGRGSTASRHASSWDRDDRDGRRERPGIEPRVDTGDGGYRSPRSARHQQNGAARPHEFGASAVSRSSRLRLRRDDDGRQAGSGELERPVAELRRLEDSARGRGLLQRQGAHLRGGPGGATPEQDDVLDLAPSHSASSSAANPGPRGVPSPPRQPRPRRRAAAATTGAGSPAITPATAATVTSAAANVMVEGPTSSPARVSSAISASSATGLSRPFVTLTNVGGAADVAHGAGDPHEFARATGLADGDKDGPGREHAHAEMQQLRGIDVERRDPRGGEVGHGRVAGEVRAPHPGEDVHGPYPSGDVPEQVQGRELLGDPLRGTPDRVGLPRDLGDEWVRKVS